jgi:protease-4
MGDTNAKAALRLVLALFGGLVALLAGWAVFVRWPASLAELLGALLALGAGAAGLRAAGRIAERVAPPYNTAEVEVKGPITRDGGGSGFPPSGPRTPGADDVVEQIEHADADEASEALVVRLNTPGGEVVPSDDIRRAAAEFDGPTVAYATDTCASGGYWIASGCDTVFAREGSIVGSIGVIGSRVDATGLAEKLGVEYERLAAGEYKDAGNPLKGMDEDDREYLQGIVDGYYDDFVERVTEGRPGLEEETVRDTEARVYLGEEALELGLVDELGTEEDVEAYLESELGEEVSRREFEPERGLGTRIRGGAAGVAYAAAAGAASALGDSRFRFE